MKKYAKILLNCSVFALLPFVADAAGTYYNRNYGNQNPGYNPQPAYNYNARGGQNYDAQNSRAGYYSAPQNRNANGRVNNRVQDAAKPTMQSKGGFGLNAGLSHQFASWKFDMKNAGSSLHYDNLNWNVFDAEATYDFSVGGTMVRLLAGGQYGMQYGDSPMVDDDLTNGGYSLQGWDIDDNGTVDWIQASHAMSIGTSGGGDMFGFHVGLGLTDVWRSGSFRMTPSIGYRYFKYKLETKNNYGLSLDTVSGAANYCVSDGGEVQCVPFLAFIKFVGGDAVYDVGTISNVDLDGDGIADSVTPIQIPAGAAYVDTQNTYYFYQSRVSHSYETEWAGPYLAMDMVYDISKTDAVNGRIEFGLPMYKSTGDQPYRPDWQHPKSLEDKASIGDAYHFGAGANWLHALSDSVMLTLGMTFDYYSVSGADATTYFSSAYYMNAYDSVDANVQASIDELAAAGWTEKSSGEIDSVYKSMGLRLGIQARF